MPELTEYTERITVCFHPDGSVKGLSVSVNERIGEREIGHRLLPVDSLSDPVAATALDTLQAKAAAQVVACQKELEELRRQAEKNTTLKDDLAAASQESVRLSRQVEMFSVEIANLRQENAVLVNKLAAHRTDTENG